MEVVRRAKTRKRKRHPGFGSSSCGFCMLEYSDSKIKVVYADELPRQSFNDMVRKVHELRTMVGNLSNVYIDMANTEFIEAIKWKLVKTLTGNISMKSYPGQRRID
jgi:hypothetical protein